MYALLGTASIFLQGYNHHCYNPYAHKDVFLTAILHARLT